MKPVGVMLVVAGLGLVVVGLLVWVGAFSWFGRLPGDIRVESGNTRVFAPLTSMLLLSVALSLGAWVLRRLLLGANFLSRMGMLGVCPTGPASSGRPPAVRATREGVGGARPGGDANRTGSGSPPLNRAACGPRLSAPARQDVAFGWTAPRPSGASMRRLSSPLSELAPHYPVVVVGSGYGGGITASRLSRAGQQVCVLERGREWLPGEFPRTPAQAVAEFQLHCAPGQGGPGRGQPQRPHRGAPQRRRDRHQRLRPGRHVAHQRQRGHAARSARVRGRPLAGRPCAPTCTACWRTATRTRS